MQDMIPINRRTIRWLPILILSLFNTFAISGKPKREAAPTIPLSSSDSVRVWCRDSSTVTSDVELELIRKDIAFLSSDLPRIREHLELNYETTGQLGFLLVEIARARDLQSVGVLTKVLLNNPRAINRAESAEAIGYIETYHKDRSAMPTLIQALDDSITDVQFNAARALVDMGDTSYCIEILAMLARGENKEEWTADWDGYMGLEAMPEEMIIEQKAQFRDGMQRKSIQLLKKLATAEALAILSDLE